MSTKTAAYIALIREDLFLARKQHDELTSRTLSTVVNAIDNAGAVDASLRKGITEAPRRELSIDEVYEIIEGEIAEMERAVELYRLSNVSDLANEMALQIEILRRLRTQGE